jgi:ADP-ribosylglycohydrolase
MLLELAIGDAYGACFECTKGFITEENNNLKYTAHPRLRGAKGTYDPVPTCKYTDDTQMSIANVEIMLEIPEFFKRKKRPWEDQPDITERDIAHMDRVHVVKVVEVLADKYLSVFKRDQRKGYTVYLLNVLLNSESGKELLTKLGGKSTKSGAFMRAAPFGLYEDVNDVIAAADMQAQVTHDSWIGRHTSVGAALMTHYLYHNLGPKDEMVEWMKGLPIRTINCWPYDDKEVCNFSNLHGDQAFEVDGEMLQPWKPGRRVRVHGWDCLESAIYAIENNDNMADILKECVAYGGDVDTNSAVAMAAASCSEEIEQNLPSNLAQNLENGSHGHDFLVELDQKFQEAFPRA